jgi:hypothetical protein
MNEEFKLIEMPESELHAWRFWSNRFAYNRRNMYAELRSIQAEEGDWPINQFLLTHVFELLLKDWSVEAILLAQDKKTLVHSFSITQLAPLFDQYPNEAKDLDHGPYHWVDRNGVYVPLRTRGVA